MDATDCIPKSAEPTDDISPQQETIVGFDEDVPDQILDFNPIEDNSFYTDYTSGGDLSEFLSRPVPIQELTWTTTAPFVKLDIQPWSLFFNDARIKKKLDNYAFISCNLHVKVVVNSSQFLYGCLMMAYTPLPDVAPTVHSVELLERVAYSQRPHINIYPHKNEGGQMNLPFVQQHNWLRVNSLLDFQQMGELTFLELAPLASANDAPSGDVNITIYAWATDVRITGNTVQVSLQSGKRKKPNKEKVTPSDEYGQGVISKPASAVARFAGHLEKVPYIAPFATATKIGASAIAKVASLFGYTNVPVIADTSPYKGFAFRNFSNCEISDPIEKLTLDPKNELSIDPRTVGLAPQDELDLTYLITREAYITQFEWTETDAPNDLLWSTRISPSFGARFPLIPQEVFQMGPMAHFSQLFRYWRGDIILRFRFVCSPFHRGRVRISWDPLGILTDPNSTTVVFTKIVDVHEDTNFEIKIPYQQRQAFQLVHSYENLFGINFYQDGPTPVNSSTFRDNGALSVRVLNTLVSPSSASAPIKVLVYARGAENLEFADPIGFLDPRYSVFQLQSGKGKTISINPDDNESEDPSQYLVYMGENIKSLRPFLRRTCLTEVLLNDTSGSLPNNAIYRFKQTKFPGAPGYDPSGTYAAVSQNLPAGPDVPYNFTNQTPFTWIVPCYLGMRGSIVWHFNVQSGTTDGAQALGSLLVTRHGGQLGTDSRFGVSVTESTSAVYFGNDNVNQASRFYSTEMSSGVGGCSVTNQITQAGMSIHAPHYNPKRFIAADPKYWRTGRIEDESNEHYYQVEIPMNTTHDPNFPAKILLEKYQSIGTDFSVFFFLGAPAIYRYPVVPSSPI